MKAQEHLNTVIRPTLSLMHNLGNYSSPASRILMLGTVAIESDMALYNKQINGPAVSPYQLEPYTINDISRHWDAFPEMTDVIRKISSLYNFIETDLVKECEINQRLACLIARGKYAMDPNPLPDANDVEGLYSYYKRVYNTKDGASTWSSWIKAWRKHGLDNVEL